MIVIQIFALWQVDAMVAESQSQSADFGRLTEFTEICIESDGHRLTCFYLSRPSKQTKNSVIFGVLRMT